MGAADHIHRRQAKRSRWCLSISCIVVFVVILAIILPVAVVLYKRKHSKGLASTVLVPLYIYPNPGAWDPLYEVVIAHPRLNFTVIINPDDGPGSSPYPNDDYTSQIQKLNTYSNVRTVGYVRTGYATRNITSVLQDVFTYSGWAAFNATALAMHGIFFDEVPSEYSSATAEYLKRINQETKNASGLQPDRRVIHNPGAIPDTRFNDLSTDVTVVFEGLYSDFQSRQAQLASLSEGRSQYSYLLHSVPASTDLGRFVDSLSRRAEFLFLTSLTQNCYESFGPQWVEFIDVMHT